MRSIASIGSRLAAPAIAAALIVAALAGPAGAMPYDNASTGAVPTAGLSAAIAAPDGHAATNVRFVTQAGPVADHATATTTAGDSTNWTAIGFAVLGGFVLLGGTTLLVRRHTGHQGGHAAPGV